MRSSNMFCTALPLEHAKGNIWAVWKLHEQGMGWQGEHDHSARQLCCKVSAPTEMAGIIAMSCVAWQAAMSFNGSEGNPHN